MDDNIKSYLEDLSSFSKRYINDETMADFFNTIKFADDYLTPQEIKKQEELFNQIKPFHKKYLEDRIRMMSLVSHDIELFEAKHYSENISIYQDSNICKKDKMIVICFCGRVNRMYLSLCIFLQAFSSKAFDIILLRDPGHFNFLNGIGDYALNLRGLTEKIEKDFQLHAYKKIICIGASSGGAAALYASLLFKAHKGICLGGRHPSKDTKLKKIKNINLDFFAFDKAIDKTEKVKTKLMCVYGNDFKPDKLGALSITEHLKSIEIIEVKPCSEHNLLLNLTKQGSLKPFIDRIIT